MVVIDERLTTVMCNIKEIREKNNMSQQELAKRLNLSQQAIAKWENGTAKPKADNLIHLAKIFGCSIDELFNNKMC